MKRILAAAALVCWVMPASATPTLDWIYPAGGQRGTSFLAEVHGSDLQRLGGVWLSGDGVTVRVLPADTDKSKPDPATGRSLKVTIAPDAALGIQEVRLYDPTGLSNPRKIEIGQWTEIQETEPNDTPATAQPVTPPVIVNGRIQSGSDQDCFRFHATRGESFVCAIKSERLFSYMGDSWLKGLLEVADPHGRVVASNDGRFHWDAVVEFTASEDGQYLVRFRDLLWRGTPSAVYRLLIGAVPYIDAVFPAGARRGTSVDVALCGINLGPTPVVSVHAPNDTALLSRDIRFTAPSGESNGIPFLFGDLPEASEKEPNDDDKSAMPITLPVVINGRMDQAGDRDCYRFHAHATTHLLFDLYANRAGSPMDSFLTLRNSKGEVVTENDDVRDQDRDSLIDFTVPADGDYVVEVRDVDDRGGLDFTYRLMISPPRPGFSLVVTPDRLIIPKGGIAPIGVSLRRDGGFTGPVELRFESLPGGITASPMVIPDGVDRWNVTLRADASCAFAAQCLQIIGKGSISGKAVERRAASSETYNEQGTAYDRPVIGPVALVGDATTVSLKSPESAMLERGSKVDLVVTVTRAAGTQGVVKLQVDGLPAGVTTDGAEVPDGKDSAALILSAAKDSKPAIAALVITGRLKTSDGKESTATAPVVLLNLK